MHGASKTSIRDDETEDTHINSAATRRSLLWGWQTDLHFTAALGPKLPEPRAAPFLCSRVPGSPYNQAYRQQPAGCSVGMKGPGDSKSCPYGRHRGHPHAGEVGSNHARKHLAPTPKVNVLEVSTSSAGTCRDTSFPGGAPCF